jgi:hypothetical protein
VSENTSRLLCAALTTCDTVRRAHHGRRALERALPRRGAAAPPLRESIITTAVLLFARCYGLFADHSRPYVQSLDQLRLNEQVLIRTDTSPTGKTGARAWHIDWAFL